MLISVVLLFCCGSMCLLKGCLEGRQAAILCFVFVHLLEWRPLKKQKGNQQKNPQKTKALLFIVVAVALTP